MQQIIFPPLPGDSADRPPISYRQATMDEAQALMQTETDYILLDVRTEMEFDLGHIPGAVNIPNERIGRHKLSSLPDEAQLILVYCRSGSRSKMAAQKLAGAGYQNIIEFGGILDWPGDLTTE